MGRVCNTSGDKLYLSPSPNAIAKVSKNEKLTIIIDRLSGVCDHYTKQGDVFISNIYKDSLTTTHNGKSLIVKYSIGETIKFTEVQKQNWDSLTLENSRIGYFKKIINTHDVTHISDAAVAATALLYGINFTPVQTLDQDTITLKVYINDKVIETKGAINWTCLDLEE